MGKTKLKGVLIHLEPERADLLSALSAETRIARSVLIREGIDDLLVKYGKLKKPRVKSRS